MEATRQFAGLGPTRQALVLLLLLWTVGQRTAHAQGNEDEYRVKAAFLYHFAQLVDWPLGMPLGNDRSLLLCTLGSDPFRGVLERMIEGKSIGDRVIRVRHLKEPASAAACQILFLGKEQSSHIPSLLADLHNSPVLTVGETSGFLTAGGMICFLLKENKIRFAINVNAAESARLRIGSRLLVLAQNLAEESRER